MSVKTSREKLVEQTFIEVYKYGYSGASTASILKGAGLYKLEVIASASPKS